MDRNRTELIRKAQSSLAAYATALSPTFQAPPHIQYLISRFEKIERGEQAREAWCLPPRHGKTTLAEYAIGHYLGRFPNRSAIFVSYGAELSEGSGRRIRALVADPLHQAIFPGCRIAEDSSAVHRFNLTAGGAFYAVGAGGTLTGRGGHLIVVDDLIKGIEEARSSATKRSIFDWYQFVLRTRCEPGAAIIAISTRWAVDDFIGMLTADASENWKLISLPAICESSGLLGKLLNRRDVIGRREGEALWPLRFDLAALERIRASIGSQAWAALYQQRPAPEEGAVFRREWWRSFSEPPHYTRLILSLDTAFKANESADYSVIQAWAEAESGYYLLHSWRGRVEFPILRAQVLEFAAQWRPSVILVEDAASGQSLLQALRAESRLPVIGCRPLGDKVARASAITPLIEAGRVFVPVAAGWLTDFMDEVSSFPASANDDQVDAMSQALTYLRESDFDWKEFRETQAMAAQYMRAQRRPVADFGVRHAPGTYFHNVHDMLAHEDGVEADGARHTILITGRSRFGRL